MSSLPENKLITSDRDLLIELHRIGVFQFGRFARDKHNPPRAFDTYQLQTGLIASYPAVLALAAEQIGTRIQSMSARHGTPIEYLYCTPESLPLATGVSLKLGMPLAYPSPGKSGHIEGAFDYHIPTAMIVDVLTRDQPDQAWIKLGESAGLRIKFQCALIAVDEWPSTGDPGIKSEFNVTAAVEYVLSEVRTELIKLGYLPQALEDVP